MSPRPLLTARALAEMLGVTPATVLRWTRAGELPGLRLPSGQVRYREDEIAAWIEARATPARGAPSTTPSAAQRWTLSSAVPSTTQYDHEE